MPSLSDLSWPRATARLTLRPAVQADLDALWKIRRQPEVSTWMTHLSDRWEDFERRAQEPSWFPATLVLELDGVVIGDLMLRIEDPWSQGEVTEQAAGVQAEIGWCIDPSAQGHGYATEGVAELIRIAFEDVGLRRVTALCFTANEPSWRLMERLGMRREAHHVQDALHRSGEWMDGYLYALLADEWRARTLGTGG